MALLAKDGLIFGLTWKWPDQNPKETKKTNGDFLHLVI